MRQRHQGQCTCVNDGRAHSQWRNPPCPEWIDVRFLFRLITGTITDFGRHALDVVIVAYVKDNKMRVMIAGADHSTLISLESWLSNLGHVATSATLLSKFLRYSLVAVDAIVRSSAELTRVSVNALSGVETLDVFLPQTY